MWRRKIVGNTTVWNSVKFNSIIHAMPAALETMRHVSLCIHSISYQYANRLWIFFHFGSSLALAKWCISEFCATSWNAWIQMNTCRNTEHPLIDLAMDSGKFSLRSYSQIMFLLVDDALAFCLAKLLTFLC